MTTSDITLTLFIIWMFSLLHTFSKLTLEFNNIKNNWNVYRCKPVIMLFAEAYGHDAYENFTHCVQNIQSTFVENDLKDVNQSNELVNDNMGTTSDALDNADEGNRHVNAENQKTTNFSAGLVSNFAVGIKRFLGSLNGMVDNVSANATLNSDTANSNSKIFGGGRDEAKSEINDLP